MSFEHTRTSLIATRSCIDFIRCLVSDLTHPYFTGSIEVTQQLDPRRACSPGRQRLVNYRPILIALNYPYIPTATTPSSRESPLSDAGVDGSPNSQISLTKLDTSFAQYRNHVKVEDSHVVRLKTHAIFRFSGVREELWLSCPRSTRGRWRPDPQTNVVHRGGGSPQVANSDLRQVHLGARQGLARLQFFEIPTPDEFAKAAGMLLRRGYA